MRMMAVLTLAAGVAGASGLIQSALAQTAEVPASQAAGATNDTQIESDAASSPVLAITAEQLSQRLNSSDICAPLSLAVNDVTSLFGVAIPSYLPIDPNLRWNQNAHTIETFIANEGTFEATIGVGCQPSSNGAILEYVGLTPERLRLPGQALCAGAVDETGHLVGADCTIEGRIVPYLSRTIDLEGRIERALTTNPDAAPAPATTQ